MPMIQYSLKDSEIARKFLAHKTLYVALDDHDRAVMSAAKAAARGAYHLGYWAGVVAMTKILLGLMLMKFCFLALFGA
jgi:hypothetical protein